jgi:hypothetical protein
MNGAHTQYYFFFITVFPNIPIASLEAARISLSARTATPKA